MGNRAKVSQSPGVDGPWHRGGGTAAYLTLRLVLTVFLQPCLHQSSMEEHHARAASAERSSADERGEELRNADDLKSAKQSCVC
ncbi:hypothetical protein NQZ68_014680 [Dissostichus eleginoides]|nr:hypothetical protein NQZ68_014680 [Dissostichus eleginoides]